MPRARLLSYNVPSLVQIGRSRDIAAALHNHHGIMLQGTRQRCRDTPVTMSKVGSHHVFDWGYGKSPFVTRAAGVQLRVHTKLAKIGEVVAVHSPPDVLQGRGGAIRLRTPVADMLLVTLYVAPRYNATAEEMTYTKGTKALFAWLAETLALMPARTSIFLGMDLNDALGVAPEGHEQDHCVGPLASDRWRRHPSTWRRASSARSWSSTTSQPKTRTRTAPPPTSASDATAASTMSAARTGSCRPYEMCEYSVAKDAFSR